MTGRSPQAGRAGRASTEPQEGLGHSATIPNAEQLVQFIYDYSHAPALTFRKKYPELIARRERIAAGDRPYDNRLATLELICGLAGELIEKDAA